MEKFWAFKQKAAYKNPFITSKNVPTCPTIYCIVNLSKNAKIKIIYIKYS